MDYKKLFKKIIRKVYSGIETIVVSVAPTLEYLKDKRVAFKSKVGDDVYYGIKFLMVLVLIYIFYFYWENKMVTIEQLITIVISLIAVLALIYLVFDAMRN